MLKIYASLAREFAHDPESIERFPGVKGKAVLALGADGPVGGDKAVAAYFVSIGELSEYRERSERWQEWGKVA